MRKFFKKSLQLVKKYLTVIIILFIFLFLYICDNVSSNIGNIIIDNLKSIATTFTPTTDLFDDGSEVSFVSYFFGMKATKQEDKFNFYLPTQMQNISTDKDYLAFNFYGSICAIANGEVSSVGYTEDNCKYIEISHSLGYKSKYIGLNNIGVSKGDKVKAKNLIGLCSNAEDVKVFIYQYENLIKPSEVEWKN